MKVSVETKGELERRMAVTVPAGEIASRYRKELSRAAKDLRLKGFRPGHVPKSEVERRFGQRLRKDIALECAQSTLPRAVEQEALTLATTPVLELNDWQEGRDLHFHATFECMPEIEMADFGELELIRPRVDITEEDIDRQVHEVCKRNVSWETAPDRASQEGDLLLFDFELSDPESGETISAQRDVQQGVGDFSQDSHAPPPSEGLKGVQPGDSPEFSWKVPEDYPVPDIAGRELIVRYTIREVNQPVVPKPDDEELLKRMGADDLASLRSNIKESMARHRDELIDSLMREQGLRRISQRTQFTLPEGMVRDQMQRERHQFEQMRQYREQQLPAPTSHALDVERPEDWDEGASRERACEYVKAALLLRRILEDHDLQVPDEALEQEVRRRCRMARDPQAAYHEILQDEEQLVRIESELRQHEAMQYIVDHASHVDRDETYESLLRLSPTDFMHDSSVSEKLEESNTAGLKP